MPTITPTDREFEILKLLWQRKKTTVREVWNLLRKNDPDLAYTTVLSVFQVMEKKGLVGHEVSGKAYLYHPLQERRKTLRSMIRNFVSRVFDGASGEFLLHGIDAGSLSPEEIDELQASLQAIRGKTEPANSARKGGRT